MNNEGSKKRYPEWMNLEACDNFFLKMSKFFLMKNTTQL
jgi:hypothetical protein